MIANWLKILLPILASGFLMWAAFVTKGVMQSRSVDDISSVLHRKINKVEATAKVDRNSDKLMLLKEIHNKDRELERLNDMLMELWKIQANYMDRHDKCSQVEK